MFIHIINKANLTIVLKSIGEWKLLARFGRFFLTIGMRSSKNSNHCQILFQIFLWKWTECAIFFHSFNIFVLSSNISRGGSRAAATSKMECFVIIVNGWKPLTIITKRSILDVTAALDQPVISIYQSLLI